MKRGGGSSSNSSGSSCRHATGPIHPRLYLDDGVEALGDFELRFCEGGEVRDHEEVLKVVVEDFVEDPGRMRGTDASVSAICRPVSSSAGSSPTTLST